MARCGLRKCTGYSAGQGQRTECCMGQTACVESGDGSLGVIGMK